MPRVSVKENKNIYFQKREALGLTREKAGELLEAIPSDRIEKIENERCEIHPEEVMIMAEKYKAPEFYNYYCSKQCPIGQKYVPEIKMQDLSQIVLNMLSSLNALENKHERFIDITLDGEIREEEYEEFIEIQEELERISITVDSLQLWINRMMANGSIDQKKYEMLMKKRKKIKEK